MNRSLQDQEIIVLDCQTSGATPSHGQIIELAWCLTSGAAASIGGSLPAVRSQLIALPQEALLSERISRITGIRAEDLSGAPKAEPVWQEVERDILALAPKTDRLVVAHFARFEKMFLEDLSTKYSASPFPARFVCTHEISRRLFPSLPRLGLRAVAGFLGYRLPECRRAADHVRATVLIWAELTRVLEESEGVTDVRELLSFLGEPPPARSAKKSFMVPEERRNDLPALPGVYRFLDTNRDVLYVGKATNLRSRVRSYFQSTRGKADHILEMLTQAYDVEYAVSATPLEAALEEVDTIKREDPPYNRALKKTDSSIWFFSADFTSRSSVCDSDHPVGPFPSLEPIASLVALSRVLSGIGADSVGEMREAHLIAFSDDLTDSVVEQGALLFQECFLAGGGAPSNARSLIAIGLTLALYFNRVDQEGADADTPDDRIGQETSITPERLARIFARLTAHAARLWQRAVWLRLLSESCLLWKTSTKRDCPQRRLLVIENAEVIDVRDLDAAVSIPAPEQWRRSMVERGAVFDQDAYDRLRVLTTEMRRLAKQENDLRVCLLPGSYIDHSNLTAILPGI